MTRNLFRAAVLFLLLCLGLLFVAAAKTYNAVDGAAGDDETASVLHALLSHAA